MRTLITEFVVTEACNLACDYCYMKDCNRSMNFQDVLHFRKHVQKIMDIYGCNKYHISYFGGEPLINWDLIQKAIPEFKSDPRLDSQVIISNGLLLTDYMVEFIKKHQIPFSFSFDGLWQDKQRPHKDVKDTLSIYKYKKDLIKQVSPGFCKTMVAPQSIDSMLQNFVFLVEEFDIWCPDFALVRDDIWSKTDIENFQYYARKLTEKTIAYFQDGMSAMPGFYSLAIMDMMNGIIQGKRPWGCFAGCSGIGYFPDRNFYPCARFGTSKELRIMDEEGNVNRENIDLLYRPHIIDPRTYAKCKACSLYNYCNAGCTYSQLIIGDDGELTAEPVDSICELYKIIYKESFHINEVLKYNKTYTKFLDNIMKPLGVRTCTTN